MTTLYGLIHVTCQCLYWKDKKLSYWWVKTKACGKRFLKEQFSVVSMQWSNIVEMRQYTAAIYVEQFTITTRVQLFISIYLVTWESTAVWSEDRTALLGRQKLTWNIVWGWSNSQISCSYAIGKNFSALHRKIFRIQNNLLAGP